MQLISTFLEVGWDFIDETENGTDDIRRILEGQDYPRLWWELISEDRPLPILSAAYRPSGAYGVVPRSIDNGLAVVDAGSPFPSVWRGSLKTMYKSQVVQKGFLLKHL